MNNIRNFFIKQCGLKDNALVQTDFIIESRRYNRMRYFWIDDCETPPEEAYVLNEDWTMHKWISN